MVIPGPMFDDHLGAVPSELADQPAWFANPQSELLAAIAELKAKLPGWYYSVCECQVSCDATIAPTTDSPDIALVKHGNHFDAGFSVDIPQPSTLAMALRHVTAWALEAKAELANQAGGAA